MLEAPSFARSNEPCADRLTSEQRELALSWALGRLDAYGERRDIELKRKRKRDGGMAENEMMENRIMNAATIASCEAAQRSVGMAHCVDYSGERRIFWQR